MNDAYSVMGVTFNAVSVNFVSINRSMTSPVAQLTLPSDRQRRLGNSRNEQHSRNRNETGSPPRLLRRPQPLLPQRHARRPVRILLLPRWRPLRFRSYRRRVHEPRRFPARRQCNQLQSRHDSRPRNGPLVRSISHVPGQLV